MRSTLNLWQRNIHLRQGLQGPRETALQAMGEAQRQGWMRPLGLAREGLGRQPCQVGGPCSQVALWGGAVLCSIVWHLSFLLLLFQAMAIYTTYYV